MSSFSLADYNAAERNAGMALAFLGVASAASAAGLVRARGPLAAMAWPLVLGALVELIVGTGMAFNAHRALVQDFTANTERMVAVATKVAEQAKSYGIATRLELALIAVSALLSLAFPKASTARAVLLGILVQGVALLCFDTFGLGRATQRLDQLTAIGPRAGHTDAGEDRE